MIKTAVKMLWCQDAKNIGLSNHLMTYIRAKVHRMITMHARPRQADRQTDGQTDERHGNRRDDSL